MFDKKRYNLGEKTALSISCEKCSRSMQRPGQARHPLCTSPYGTQATATQRSAFYQCLLLPPRNKRFRLTAMSEKGGGPGTRDPLSAAWEPGEGDLLSGKTGCPAAEPADSGSGCACVTQLAQAALIQQLSSWDLFYRAVNPFSWNNLFAAYTLSNSRRACAPWNAAMLNQEDKNSAKLKDDILCGYTRYPKMKVRNGSYSRR